MTDEERAKAIAEKANECCGRSDGWEEDVYALALKHLKAVRKEVELKNASGTVPKDG